MPGKQSKQNAKD